MVEVYRGVIYPWQCDHMGHMNNMYYVHMFDQGEVHLLSIAGFNWKEAQGQDEGLADVRQEIEYKREQVAGNLVEIQGGVLRIGNSSFTVSLEMRETGTGEIAASCTSTLVLFDLKLRKSKPIPNSFRSHLERFILD